MGSPRRANARQAITDIFTIYHKYRHHYISSHSLSCKPAHQHTCTQAGQEPMESQPRREAPVPKAPCMCLTLKIVYHAPCRLSGVIVSTAAWQCFSISRSHEISVASNAIRNGDVCRISTSI